MELKSLKRTRMLFPGLYVVIQIILIVLSLKDNSQAFSEALKYTIKEDMLLPYAFVLLIGFIYYAFDCRDLLWSPILRKVWDNIYRRLFRTAKEKFPAKLSEAQKRKMKRFFYGLIDDDHTLTIKSQLVMHNGAILTCVLDALILSVPFIILDIVLSVINSKVLVLALVINCVILFIGIFIRASLVKKHISLSNDQLDIIEDKYSAECSSTIKGII